MILKARSVMKALDLVAPGSLLFGPYPDGTMAPCFSVRTAQGPEDAMQAAITVISPGIEDGESTPFLREWELPVFMAFAPEEWFIDVSPDDLTMADGDGPPAVVMRAGDSTYFKLGDGGYVNAETGRLEPSPGEGERLCFSNFRILIPSKVGPSSWERAMTWKA